jgi:hypothetical protein
VLDGNSFTIDPGSSQELSGKESWLIQFERGGNNGSARYTLTDGTYTFSITNKGWELSSAVCDVTLDNSANAADFNYLNGDRVETVPAGQSKALSSRFPIVVRFDRGDGGPPVARRLQGQRTYRVAWDPAAQAIDLIGAKAAATGGGGASLTPTSPTAN